VIYTGCTNARHDRDGGGPRVTRGAVDHVRPHNTLFRVIEALASGSADVRCSRGSSDEDGSRSSRRVSRRCSRPGLARRDRSGSTRTCGPRRGISVERGHARRLAISCAVAAAGAETPCRGGRRPPVRAAARRPADGAREDQSLEARMLVGRGCRVGSRAVACSRSPRITRSCRSPVLRPARRGAVRRGQRSTRAACAIAEVTVCSSAEYPFSSSRTAGRSRSPDLRAEEGVARATTRARPNGCRPRTPRGCRDPALMRAGDLLDPDRRGVRAFRARRRRMQAHGSPTWPVRRRAGLELRPRAAEETEVLFVARHRDLTIAGERIALEPGWSSDPAAPSTRSRPTADAVRAVQVYPARAGRAVPGAGTLRACDPASARAC